LPPSATRSVAKNTVLLTVGLFSGRILALFIQKKMTPLLGPDGMGIWALATDLVTILLVISRFGLDVLLTRDVSRDPAVTWPLLWAALRVRWLLAAACYGFLLIYLPLTGEGSLTRAAVLITAVSLFVESTSMACDAVLQARNRVEVQTWGQVASAVAYFGLSLWWLDLGWGVMGVIWANLISRFVRLAVMAPLMFRWCGPWRGPHAAGAEVPSLRGMLHFGLPVFLNTTFGVIALKIDTVLLNEMVGKASAGIYYLGHRALDVLLIAPNIFATAFFPALARAAATSRLDAIRLGERALRFMLLVALPGTFFLALTAEPIILWFARGMNDADPDAFRPSVLVMQVVIWGLPFMAASHVFYRVLLSAGKERVFWRIGLAQLVANLALNAVLIPRWQHDGAAAATVVSMGVSFLLHLVYAQATDLKLPLRRTLVGVPVALAVAWFAALGLVRLAVPAWFAGWGSLPTDRGWPAFLVVCALVAALYVVAVFGLRVLDRRDLQLLPQLLRRSA